MEPIKQKRKTPAQKKAYDYYRFVSALEDRYLGSVFVTPAGQAKHEAAVKNAYEACKALGMFI